jgi:DnaJ-class molecular chaperone
LRIERIGAITRPGEHIRIPGEGMPILAGDGEEEGEPSSADGPLSAADAARSAGALLVSIAVDFPEELSADAREWAERALPS